nr:MAG TPA: hypothetical protein [Crassvirales sp.]
MSLLLYELASTLKRLIDKYKVKHKLIIAIINIAINIFFIILYSIKLIFYFYKFIK